MIRDSVADANGNFAATFVRLSDHSSTGGSHTVGDVTAVSSGFEIPFFNRVFVFTSPARDDLAAAVEWMVARGDPFLVTVADTALPATKPLASDFGLESTGDTQPGMVLPSLDEIPNSDDRVDIESVTDTAGLATFAEISAATFEMPLGIASEAMPESTLSEETLEPLLARVDGVPVGCGLLARSDDIAGVYTIGVLEEYRRRGIGEALTWGVLRAGREAGCEVGILQSSQLGYSVYEKMGFETIVEYHQFHPA
jgi:GNAT superfamily N-acetyltransferase